MLRVVRENHRLLQKEARALLVDKNLLSPYYVPGVAFEVNFTDKVQGDDILGRGNSQKWEMGPSSPERSRLDIDESVCMKKATKML